MSARDLIITAPTDDERVQTWAGTHQLWGAALTLEDYLERERRQLDIPLARNGGLTNWILTEAASPAGAPRPILSSCETLKKRVLVKGKDGKVTEGTAHGVASVFTQSEHRGKGYASTMMSQLSETLADKEKTSEGSAICSVLWSDIGKKFYARSGWQPFDSNHVEFSALQTPATIPENIETLDSLETLAPLVEADEAILRARFESATQGPKIQVALLPSLDQIHWHLLRERFVSQSLFPERTVSPSHGAIYTSPTTGKRVWSLWTRSYSGKIDQPEKNTLYLLRLVVEDGIVDAELKTALQGITDIARSLAGQWACGKVEMWNPDEKTKAAAQALGGKYISREEGSLPALNWFGKGPAEDVEWIWSEKYAWC